MHLFLSFILCLALMLPSSLLSSPDFAKTECDGIFNAVGFEGVIINHRATYEAMKERILKTAKEKDFWLIVSKVIQTVGYFEDRVRKGSYLYDPDVVIDHLFDGIFLYAETIQDLINANEMFYKVDPFGSTFQTQLQNSATHDLHLHYFAARMAFLALAYKTQTASSKSRDEALSELQSFEGMNAQVLRLHSIEGRTLIDTQDPVVLSRFLQREGITNIVSSPLPPHDLVFNNGRRYFEYSAAPKEKWVAQYLAAAHPDERYLGLGDESVRQFYRLFMYNAGANKLYYNPPTCDFLTIDIKNSNSFHLRELKFVNRYVDIGKALKQLRVSAIWLLDAYPTILTDTSEILLPNVIKPDGSAESIHLGGGYQVGPPVNGTSGKRHFLLDRNGHTVILGVGARRLPVVLHLFDILEFKYLDLKN